MTVEELRKALEEYPPDSIVMISDPRENAYYLGEVMDGTSYIYDDLDDPDEESEKEVPAVWLQARWEHN